MPQVQRSYHHTGSLKREILFSAGGKDWMDNEYFPSGRLLRSSKIVGKRPVWIKQYDEDGDLIEVLLYRKLKLMYSSSCIGGKHRRSLYLKGKVLKYEYSEGVLTKRWKWIKKEQFARIYVNDVLTETIITEGYSEWEHKWLNPDGSLNRIEIRGVEFSAENYLHPETIDPAVFSPKAPALKRSVCISMLIGHMAGSEESKLLYHADGQYKLISRADGSGIRYLKITTSNGCFIYSDEHNEYYSSYSPDGINTKQLYKEGKRLGFHYVGGKLVTWHKKIEKEGVTQVIHNGVLRERIVMEGRVEREHKWFDENGVLEKVAVFGALLPLEHYLHPERLDPKLIIYERNATLRRAYIALIGYSTLLGKMPYKVRQKDGEYELIELEAPNEILGVILLLKVVCPSTGVFYTLRVDPRLRTCRGALAWTFQVPESEYKLEEEA